MSDTIRAIQPEPRTTCEECDRLGWPTRQALHTIDGRVLCWTHAQLAEKEKSVNDNQERK